MLKFSLVPLMENIIEPNESFNFENLSLAHPVSIQGGAYFTKLQNNNKALYIQTSKGSTRQGFVKTGKKYYCDLMFDKNSEELINWFEKLEERCQQLIYEKSETWFQNALEMNDVEGAFNSIIRIYKSGKFYLVRTNIKNSTTNEPFVKIYNEQEITLNHTDINPETNIITILEIQGIKFTSRNFQIEIELKQMMVLNEEPIFENCLIKQKKVNSASKIDKESENLPEIIPLEPIDPPDPIDTLQPNDVPEIISSPLATDHLTEILTENFTENFNGVYENTLNDLDMHENETLQDSLEINIDVEDLDKKKDQLTEVDPPIANDLETINIKKPNQVYFNLYKESKIKAKQAKKNAILAYLEAKKIKKTFLLDNLDDSDSDFDEEIEEVSESELEGL